MIVPPSGLRLYTPFENVPVFEQRLVGNVMPDILRTGGISKQAGRDQGQEVDVVNVRRII